MQHVLELNIPDDQRVFIVSDMHGMKSVYDKGCKDLGITKDDVVISVGDYIDRGKQNFACLIEFARGENRYGVIGNHEDMLIKGVLEGSREWEECWLANGGIQTFLELGEAGIVHLAEICKEMPTVIEVNHRGRKLGVIHAGIPLTHAFREHNWEEICGLAETKPQYRHQLVWDREVLGVCQYEEAQKPEKQNMPSNIEGVDYVFHGHSYVKEPEIYGNRVYMDTGSYFNNKICFSWVEDDGSIGWYRTGDWDNV